MVPYNSRRTESQLPVVFLEAPADIHIVARDAETFIETSNFKQRGLPIGHVASRNVLCLAIGQQYVDGAARCI